jgi:hypothetical protein
LLSDHLQAERVAAPSHQRRWPEETKTLKTKRLEYVVVLFVPVVYLNSSRLCVFECLISNDPALINSQVEARLAATTRRQWPSQAALQPKT